MPDCSKGLKSRNTRSAQGNQGGGGGGGARNNRERCRNCEILEARLHDAKQTLKEVKKELRRKIRELRNKRERMNLILLTIIDICDQECPKLNRRAIEERIKNPAFLRGNFDLASSIASLVDRYHEEIDGISDYDVEEDEE